MKHQILAPKENETKFQSKGPSELFHQNRQHLIEQDFKHVEKSGPKLN